MRIGEVGLLTNDVVKLQIFIKYYLKFKMGVMILLTKQS